MKASLLLASLIIIFLLTGCSLGEGTSYSPPLSSPDITSTQNEGEALQSGSATHNSPELVIEDDEFVRVADYLPEIFVELKYATNDNFTKTSLYDFTDAYLRYGTVKKLLNVQTELSGLGYSLKIWDAFRPVAIQFLLWEICPDPIFVADPNKGFSSHSKGSTIDVTLVKSDGSDVLMPSGFDEFSSIADRDYSDVSAEEAANARLLEDTMINCGFIAYDKEWWHFSDADDYPIEKIFYPLT